ncbi:hypothetical protein BDV11DRAFT_131387 [Aspergillus similis]
MRPRSSDGLSGANLPTDFDLRFPITSLLSITVVLWIQRQSRRQFLVCLDYVPCLRCIELDPPFGSAVIIVIGRVSSTGLIMLNVKYEHDH